jgi:iron complex transport system substrate-binding protein
MTMSKPGALQGRPVWILGVAAIAAALIFTPMASGREVRDEVGRKVRVPRSPRRIISLAPSITECLYALGAGQSVVGVTRFSNYPPEAASLPKVGSYVHVDLEHVISLRPDLIIAIRDGNPKEVVARLERMGLPVFVVDPRSVEDLFRTLRGLGALVGRRGQAEELVEDLQRRLDRIRREVQGKPRPRVLLQIGVDPLVSVGDSTLQGQLIELAGGQNIAGDGPILYPILSMERVLEADPDVILVSSMVGEAGSRRALREWSRWPTLQAVRKGRVHLIDGDLIDRPSPRILEGLENMVQWIHPEIPLVLHPAGSDDVATRGGKGRKR